MVMFFEGVEPVLRSEIVLEFLTGLPEDIEQKQQG